MEVAEIGEVIGADIEDVAEGGEGVAEVDEVEEPIERQS